MGLVLCNSYPTTIQTSIMFYSPESCGGDGGNFEKMGWWRIAPGSCALVYANDLEDVNRSGITSRRLTTEQFGSARSSQVSLSVHSGETNGAGDLNHQHQDRSVSATESLI